ncbi:hypothetical protein BIW11_01893 [Tropilaelaps mercedesae]|uniref:C2H2-type domain-containing protein n=1 Tax=Tropilaelaps mercedesae TaxID=418985 RepID=A0A1V9X6F7_9ACAR|nr:hypothetical protein BIW11_01893 [Tropilaelaps mercedesae]
MVGRFELIASKGEDASMRGLFSCSACHLQFPLLTELRQHYRANHYRGDGERRFECTLCHYEFKQKIHLQRHMEKKHFVPQVRPAGSKARSPLPASQLSQMQLLEGGCRTSVGSATAQGSRGSASRATDGGPGAGGDLVPFRPPGTSELTLDYRTLHSAMIENLQKAIEARSAQNMFELSNMLNVRQSNDARLLVLRTVAAAVRAAGASQDKGDEEK